MFVSMFDSALEKLLQRSRDGINDLMKGQFNALHIAITNDHVECARVLIVEVGPKIIVVVMKL